MDRIKIRKVLFIVMCFLLSIVCVIFSPSLSNGTAGILEDSFILSFLGLFSGLSIACITFMLVNIDKIRHEIHESSSIQNSTKMDETIDALIEELRQDTIATILSLVICFIAILIRDIDFSGAAFFVNLTITQQVISIIELTLIMITICAIIDIVESLFGLNRVLSVIERDTSNLQT